ncbi:MAG: hypothetical protein L3J59_11050 [Methylococcaceae bacterium]|nr:hypothetical protein [Methylococcaceae bacterium]
MRNKKGISISFVIGIIFGTILYARVISYFQGPQINLDKRILSVGIAKDIKFVGYRNNVGGATVGYTYRFYILAEGGEISHPFLITSNADVTYKINSPTEISITTTEDILSYDNRVWVPINGELTEIKINLISKTF